jgi:Flp pilus assembly protein TadB
MNTVYLILSNLLLGIGICFIVISLLEQKLTKDYDKIKPDREMHMRSIWYRFFTKAADFIIDIHPKKDKLTPYLSSIQKRLLLAGEPMCFTPQEFLVLKELVCLGVFVASLVCGFSIIVSFLLSIAGFYYPDLWIKELYKKRRVAILKELPFTLDLLTLSIEAGLDLTGSISRIVEKNRQGILHIELFQFLQELKMGKGRKQALIDMADRMGVPEITSLANAIIMSDELGSGLARTLRIQSQEFRTKRFQRAEKLAMEAPVKMTFPLLFIFASVFLLLFGSFAVQALRGRLF